MFRLLFHKKYIWNLNYSVLPGNPGRGKSTIFAVEGISFDEGWRIHSTHLRRINVSPIDVQGPCYLKCRVISMLTLPL